MLVRVAAGEAQPVCPAIVMYIPGKFLAELQDEWDRGENQDDAEDDKKQTGSQVACQECTCDGSNGGTYLQEQSYAHIGQVIAHIGCRRAARCSDDCYNAYPDGVLDRQSKSKR